MLLILILAFPPGCGHYRIEREKRSPIYFNEQYVEGGIQRQQTLDDGTILIYEPIDARSSLGRSGNDRNKSFKIRETTEDDEVVLKSLLPQHVLMNLLNCLRAEEYRLIYDQLLAEKTRDSYERQEGFEGFAAYMRRNRLELAKLLTRMIAGLPQQQVRFDRIGEDVTRCRLRPQVAEQFKFKRVDVVRETSGLYKLLMVG